MEHLFGRVWRVASRITERGCLPQAAIGTCPKALFFNLCVPGISAPVAAAVSSQARHWAWTPNGALMSVCPVAGCTRWMQVNILASWIEPRGGQQAFCCEAPGVCHGD